MTDGRDDSGATGDGGRGPGWRRIGLVAVPVVVVLGIVAALAMGGDDGGERAVEQVPGTRSTVSSTPSTTVSTVVVGQTSEPAATTVPGTDTTIGGTPVTTAAPTPRPGARIQVKFVDGSGVRLRDGGFVSLTGQDLSALRESLGHYPGATIERLFQRAEADLDAERAANEARTGTPQPDLNLYFRVTLAEGVDAGAAIADLNGLDVVESAYADPAAAPPPMN
jgi:hypothetical protein